MIVDSSKNSIAQNIKLFPYEISVYVHDIERYKDIIKWCDESTNIVALNCSMWDSFIYKNFELNFEKQDYALFFDEEESAMLFKLIWK